MVDLAPTVEGAVVEGSDGALALSASLIELRPPVPNASDKMDPDTGSVLTLVRVVGACDNKAVAADEDADEMAADDVEERFDAFGFVTVGLGPSTITGDAFGVLRRGNTSPVIRLVAVKGPPSTSSNCKQKRCMASFSWVIWMRFLGSGRKHLHELTKRNETSAKINKQN
eukprot:m.133702 g.133702  ORF g.133702 m.133702 type:complete len:170 (-) comp13947_c0_seq1:118-627(-)